jgi:hypothetical protein
MHKNEVLLMKSEDEIRKIRLTETEKQELEFKLGGLSNQPLNK